MPDQAMWQPGAFITNGRDLYEVRTITTSGSWPASTRWLDVENCRTLTPTQFPDRVIERDFKLVRSAPSCPDFPQPASSLG